MATRKFVLLLLTAATIGLAGGGSYITTADARPPEEGLTRELKNSMFTTNKGQATGDGGCTFSGYRLTLPAGKTAIEARHVAVDYETCTEIIEVGEPTSDIPDSTEGRADEAPTHETASASSADVIGDTGSASGATASRTARFAVWWEDAINADVTLTEARVTYNYGGGCVSTVTSWTGYWWWLVLTGWERTYATERLIDYWYSGNCLGPYLRDAVEVEANSNFRNRVFCIYGTVYNYYRGVSVYGTAHGVSGWVDSTWTTYPHSLCPRLHWHSRLYT